MFPPFEWKTLSPSPVIGVDEVGRGCLAGRVYAAAVILQSDEGIEEYTDSKLLTKIRREKLAKHILEHHKVGIGFATVEEIDNINILKAALLAMKRAVELLGVSNGHLVVDGTFKVPGLIHLTQTTLIKGDLRCAPVAAASIVAKVTRDRYMAELSNQYPQYDFAKHKGYSTQIHKQKIAEFGASPEHRKTFRGVREYV
ncbi:MAG: ribonuclease HII [Bdellovibrionota bacterium]